MSKKDRQQRYEELRKKYPEFCYQSFKYEQVGRKLDIEFKFLLGDVYTFYPKHSIQLPEKVSPQAVPKEEMDLMVFHLGMVELVSYWKASCSPLLKINAFKLSEEQIKWWKKLYFEGLGEFFYLNGIDNNIHDFMDINCENAPIMPSPSNHLLEEKVLVPIGGGKDSVVSLELLKDLKKPLIPFVVNPRGATFESIKNAGFGTEKALFTKRSIHPQLLDLNAQGFLNGHTPFSAMLAFLSLIVARLSNSKYIALSNESSANESTVSGTNINHQYSKSYEFEKDFRIYYQKYIQTEIEYFSFLRPLSEIQIACLFSKMTNHHFSFKSCNVGSKENKWCGHCSKCLFTYILLSPFIEQKELHQIFGKSLLEDESLEPILLELRGKAESKPFECVGTVEEVELSLQNARKEFQSEIMLASLSLKSNGEGFSKALAEWNPIHFLPIGFESLLQEKLKSCRN